MLNCYSKIVSVGTILYRNKVASLFTITINCYLLAKQHLACKNRHHTRLPVRVLPGTKNVRIAKDCIVKAVVKMVHEQIVLNGMLACPVLADGINRIRLQAWDSFRLAVGS